MDRPAKKTFTEGDFQITLTDEFEETKEEGYFSIYRSKTAKVATMREPKTIFGDITLEEYCDLVAQANGRSGAKVHKEDGFLWFDYTNTTSEQALYCVMVCCEGEDAFWIVNFATPVTNQGKYKETFFDWARTIQVD